MPKVIPEDSKPLLMKRQLTLIGDVTGIKQEALSESIIYLNALGNEPITLFIDSCGGFTLSGLVISDIIENSVADVHGVVIGFAYSSAFTVLQACYKRITYKHARLMFHPTTLNGLRIDDVHFDEKLDKVRQIYEDFLLIL